MVALLGGTVPPDAPRGGPSEGLPLDAVLGMLYPSREPSELHAVAYGLVGDFVDLHGLRQILTTFDRQFFPSPGDASISGPDDIVTHRSTTAITLYPGP